MVTRVGVVKSWKAGRTLAILVALTALIVCLASAQARAASDSFVGRTGQDLTLNGASWRFIAYNNYQLTSLPGGYDCGQADTQADLDEVMQSAAASGASVIRTWFFQSYYDLNAQGERTSPSWTPFNRVLDTAARYGLKVIPVLVNEYQQCEPASVTKNLGFFQSGYEQSGYGYPLSFRQYATTVAQHYADDPTVAFWQIGNELYDDTPGGCSSGAESQGAQALRSFADSVTNAIKSVDPNHLVSLGTEGTGQCGLEGSDYQYVMAGAVDLCEYHDYDAVTDPIPNDGYNRLAQRIQQCQALNKPLFIGESGIPADVNAQGNADGPVTASSLQLRARFYAAKMQAAFGAGVVGYGLWDKEQAASNSTWNANEDQDFGIGPSDPTNTVTADIAATLNPNSTAPYSVPTSTPQRSHRVAAPATHRTPAHHTLTRRQRRVIAQRERREARKLLRRERRALARARRERRAH
jgi:mannan endo-1,4-beta-mannosidase